MTETELRQRINEHIELIKHSRQGMKEASERCTAFLVMMAILNDEKRITEDERSKIKTIETASYAQAVSRSQAKQVTEKKIEAEQDVTYTQIREALEECESKISWLRNLISIFENAHITYRTFAKEG